MLEEKIIIANYSSDKGLPLTIYEEFKKNYTSKEHITNKKIGKQIE
jgi:hypothetical protein